MKRDKIRTQTCYIHQCTNKVMLMYIACLCPNLSSLPGHYSTYVPSAREAARYRAKELVTDNALLEVCSANTTLLAGLLIVLVNILTKVHAAACLVSNQTAPY